MKNASKDTPCKANHRQLVSRPIPRRFLCLMVGGCLPLLLGANCGLETCDIFNCDTLPFIEELLAPDEHAEDMHDEGDEHIDDDHGDMADMDGMTEDHDDMEGMPDEHDDTDEEHDEDMPEDDDDHMGDEHEDDMHDDVHMDDGLDESTNGDDHDTDAEDHNEDEEG